MAKNDDPKIQTIKRPPIITVMGHVDHGKTSILDKIRNTQVQSGEHGGITQSIGAYQVEHKGHPLTFIDTPGHEAFTQMRARGGEVADIVILVVAADDGVKPQTIEAIHHAQASKAPMVVAINKIDLDTANPEKVKKELAGQGVVVNSVGGDIESIETSAQTGKGLDQLLDVIIRVADQLDLTAETNTPAAGYIIESRLDSKKGPMATGIVMKGELRVRDAIVAGKTHARVKSMADWKGQELKQVGPSQPVEIMGFSDVPELGVSFSVVGSVKEAQQQVTAADEQEHISIAERVRQAFQQGDIKEVALVVKADSQGSLEAVMDSIKGLGSDEVRVKVLHHGVGEINENDIFLAMPMHGIVLGFGVSITKPAEQLARKEKVINRTYTIIYHLLEELNDVISGEIEALQEKITGVAEVLKVFELSDGTFVAGSIVQEGEIRKGHRIRFSRGDETIGESNVSSLRIRQEDVNKVEAGEECGIITRAKIDIKIGDKISCIE